MFDRETARKATIIAFRNRVIGHVRIAGEVLGHSRVVYDGDFPYQTVADAVDIPDSPAIGQHRKAWSSLYKLFDEEWRCARE